MDPRIPRLRNFRSDRRSELPTQSKTMSEFAVRSLLNTPTVVVDDVCCLGSRRDQGYEERTATTQVVFPYRGVYVRHLGQDQTVADGNQVPLRLRLSRALDLVAQYDDLTALSLDLGFSSHSHFSASFRQMYGCSPSAFRQSAVLARPLQSSR